VKCDLTSAIAAIKPGRPLIVTDADGVLLKFTGCFEHWLDERDLYLDLTAYRLEGGIRRRDDNTRLLDVECLALVEEYREDLDDLDAVDGACEALAELSEIASVVVLSNVNAIQAKARLRNFARLDIAYPLIANDGGGGYLADKGAAMRALAAHARAKTFFIDDIPSNLADVAKAAPDVTLVHVVESEPLRVMLGSDFHAHCYAKDWTEVKRFILEALPANPGPRLRP
jgi:hypothetical protein